MFSSRCLAQLGFWCAAAALAGPSVGADASAGLVTSQAVTVAGQDFCRHFTAAWREHDGSDAFAIAIRERPSARWGSEVDIEFAQRRVYHARLPPARAGVEAMARDAAATVLEAVRDADGQRRLNLDPDLAPDEM